MFKYVAASLVTTFAGTFIACLGAVKVLQPVIALPAFFGFILLTIATIDHADNQAKKGNI